MWVGDYFWRLARQVPDATAWEAALSKMKGGIPLSVSLPKKRQTLSAPESGAQEEAEPGEARGGKKKKFKGGGGGGGAGMKGGKRQSSAF